MLCDNRVVVGFSRLVGNSVVVSGAYLSLHRYADAFLFGKSVSGTRSVPDTDRLMSFYYYSKFTVWLTTFHASTLICAAR